MPEGRYIYAVVDTRKKLKGPIVGLGDSDVYNIAFKDLGAVVSDYPGAEPPAQTPENLAVHRQVIGRLRQNYTVLPVTFGTILGPAESMEAVLQANYAMLCRHLACLQGRVEMRLTAFWVADESIGKYPAFIQQFLCREKVLQQKTGAIVKMHEYHPQPHDDETGAVLLSAVYHIPKTKVPLLKRAIQEIGRGLPQIKIITSGPWAPEIMIALTK